MMQSRHNYIVTLRYSDDYLYVFSTGLYFYRLFFKMMMKMCRKFFVILQLICRSLYIFLNLVCSTLCRWCWCRILRRRCSWCGTIISRVCLLTSSFRDPARLQPRCRKYLLDRSQS